MVDAVDSDDVRPVERVFIGDPLVSEAIFRLAKASREGRPLQEELRVPAPNGGAARWLRFRVRPLQENSTYARWTAWNITDVSAQLNGKTVMTAQWGPAVSKNPFLQFTVKGAKAGDKITINWVDNHGDKRTDEATVS